VSSRVSEKEEKRRCVETSCGKYGLQKAKAQVVRIVTSGPGGSVENAEVVAARSYSKQRPTRESGRRASFIDAVSRAKIGVIDDKT